MASDPSMPSLALSDIIHTMSPSPSPQQLPELRDTTAHQRDSSPEPLTQADLANIHRRIEEMGLISAGGGSERERELVDMVLRLTESTIVDSSQVVRQAELISELTSQRDYLLKSAEQERDLWEAERDGWQRNAEALIAQRNRLGSAAREEDLERQCASYHADNRNLRARLLDTQNRLSLLESELKHLKPLLLMHVPAAYSAPQTTGSGKGKGVIRKIGSTVSMEPPILEEPSQSSTAPFASSSSGPSSNYLMYSYAPYATHASSSAAPPRTIMSTSQPQAGPSTSTTSTPSAQHKKSRTTKASTTKRTSTTGTTTTSSTLPILPLTSDARTEHILLAARKIGRERATLAAGILKDVEREKEKLVREQEQLRMAREAEKLERERLERLASGSAGTSYYRRDTVNTGKQPGPMPTTPTAAVKPPAGHYLSPTSFVFVGVPGGGAAGSGGAGGAMYSGTGVIGTPNQVAAHERQIQHTPVQAHAQSPLKGPSTPFDSLWTAARSMMDDGNAAAAAANSTTDDRTIANVNGRRKANAIDEPESPLPKRRRVSTSGKAGSGGVDRVRSALDVLADQAAAAFSEETTDQGSANSPSAKAASAVKAKAKVKGKAKAVEPPDDDEVGSSKGPGKGKVKARERASKVKQPPPPEPVTRKPRTRPPPRDRNLSVSAAEKAKAKETAAGPPAPRLIAPAGGKKANRRGDISQLDVEAAAAELHHVQVSLRPVVAWGKRRSKESTEPSSPMTDEGVPEKALDSADQLKKTGANPTAGDQTIDVGADNEHNVDAAESKPAGIGNLADLENIEPNPQEEPSRSITHNIDSASVDPTDPRVNPSDVTGLIAEELHDMDAEAEEDAQDGEDDTEEKDEVESELDPDNLDRDRPPRSRSPPPPGPPPPPSGQGAPGPEPDDDNDPDADAEGEVDDEAEDSHEPPSGTTSASTSGQEKIKALHPAAALMPVSVFFLEPSSAKPSKDRILTVGSKWTQWPMETIIFSQSFSVPRTIPVILGEVRRSVTIRWYSHCSGNIPVCFSAICR